MTGVKHPRPPVPEDCHGTWEGHEHFGCCCEPCVQAWNTFRGDFLATQAHISQAYFPVMAETEFSDILDLALRHRREP